MATLTKTYDFAADAQGFASSPGSAASTMSWTGGVLQTVLAGSAKSDTNSWDLTTTFEAMGVPAGSIITGITTNSAQAKCTAFASGTGCTNGAVTLLCDGVTVTLSASRSFSATDASFVTTNGTDNAATNFGSNEAVTITIPNHLGTTSGGSGKGVTLQQDNVTFTITYIDAKLLFAREVSTRSRAPKPAYYMLRLSIIQNVQTFSDSIAESITLADTTDATTSTLTFPIVGARLRSRAPKPALYSILQGILPRTSVSYSDSVSEALSLLDTPDGTSASAQRATTVTIYTPRRPVKAVVVSVVPGILPATGTSFTDSIHESIILSDTTDGAVNILTLDKTAAKTVYSRTRPRKSLISIIQGTLPDTAPIGNNVSVSEAITLADSGDGTIDQAVIKRTPLYIYLGAAAERRQSRTSRTPLANAQNVAVSETISLASTVSVRIDWLPSVVEAVSLSTVQSIGAILSAARVEAISFVDTESAVLASSDADGETVALADTLNAIVIRGGVAVAEGLVTNDLYLARTATSASRSETMTLSDSMSATINKLVAVQETMALTDGPTCRGVMSTNFADRIFISDSTDAVKPGAVSGGGNYLINRRRRK